MSVTFTEEKRPPKTRCIGCNKTTIDVVCSVCGDPICLACNRTMYARHSFLQWDSQGDPDIGTARGFVQHILGRKPSTLFYCRDCARGRIRLLFVLFCALIYVPLGVWLYFYTGGYLFWLSAAGVALIPGIAEPILQSRHARRTTRPPFHVNSKTSKVKIEEKIEGNCTIEESKYKTEVVSNIGTGILSYHINIEPEMYKQAEAYKKRYRRPPVQLNAGFAILRGRVALRETELVEGLDPVETGDFPAYLPFGQVVAADSYLNTGDLRQNGRNIEQKRTYQFESKTFPIQLIPYLVTEIEEEGREQWGLQLIIRVHPKVRGMEKLVKDEIKLDTLRLEVSDYITPLQYAEPNHHSKEEENVIIWKGGAIKIDEPTSIYMRFASNGVDDLVNFTMSGKLVVSFKGILSSIDDVDQFTADGHKRQLKTDENKDDPDVKICEFEKSVTATAVFNFNCNQMAVRRRIQKSGRRVAPIAPNYKLVIALVDKLNEKKFYVKGVQEKKPEIDQMDAYIMKRYWVIDVRKYGNLYPIDFTLILNGKEFSPVHLLLGENASLPHIVAHAGHETHFTVTAHATVPISVASVNDHEETNDSKENHENDDYGKEWSCKEAKHLAYVNRKEEQIVYSAIDEVCRYFCEIVEIQQSRESS